MRGSLILVMMGILCLCAGSVFAQDVTIDLTSADTAQVIVKVESVVDTMQSDTALNVDVPSATSVELLLKHGDTEHGSVKFEVSSTGEISEVSWKADASDTVPYTPMDTSRYSLSEGDTKVVFEGCNVGFDLTEVDYAGFSLYYFDPAELTASLIPEFTGGGNYTLFPGNYTLWNSVSGSSIDFLLEDDCSFNPEMYHRVGEVDGGEKEVLHGGAVSIDGSQFALVGRSIDVRTHLHPGQTAALVGFEEGVSSLDDNVARRVRMGAGRFQFLVKEGASDVAKVEFELLNATNALSTTVMWQDLEGNLTEGGMREVEPGRVYVGAERMEAYEGFPPEEYPDQMPYAVLKDRLDAGYYLAKSGELRLRYDERYHESLDLNLRILNGQNQEVALSNPVARQYGTNWITLQLPANDFNVGEYYVLEVRSEKGDLTMLRFRYE